MLLVIVIFILQMHDPTANITELIEMNQFGLILCNLVIYDYKFFK